jgi:hypothetical protein
LLVGSGSAGCRLRKVRRPKAWLRFLGEVGSSLLPPIRATGRAARVDTTATRTLQRAATVGKRSCADPRGGGGVPAGCWPCTTGACAVPRLAFSPSASPRSATPGQPALELVPCLEQTSPLWPTHPSGISVCGGAGAPIVEPRSCNPMLTIT